MTDTAKVKFRGGYTCSCVAELVPVAEQRMLDAGIIKYNIDIWQLGYRNDVAASAGTHAKGGVIDVAQYSTAALKIWRELGMEMQHRTRAQGFDMDHGHGVVKGCPHVSSGAKSQQVSWEAGKNGLKSNGPITGPGPTGKTTPTWASVKAGLDKGPHVPTNPNGVKKSDVVLVTASSGLVARVSPGGENAGSSLTYGTKFTVQEIDAGWVLDPSETAVQVAKTAEEVNLVNVLSTGYLPGADISSWQGADWKLADEEYVFVKATEGSTYANPERAAQLRTVREAGKVAGHYHWLVKGNVQAQVDWFLANADIKAGDLIALDWEDGSLPTNAEKDAWIKAVKERTQGRNKVGLYCNRYWWTTYDTTSYYGDFLWIAEYGVTKPSIQTQWTFWQYTDKPYDKNHGGFASLAALQAWAGPTDPEPVPSDGLWYSSDYLFPQTKPDPKNAAGIKKGDTVVVQANGGLFARTLPGGPRSQKDGQDLIRPNGYEFDVTGDPVDGWITGGTNWYSSDYLAKKGTPVPPSKPSWSTAPKVILAIPSIPNPVTYLQDVTRVAAVKNDNGSWAECYVMAQAINNDKDTRFLLFDAKGAYAKSWMTVKGGGHGSSFHAYRSAAGNLYIWTWIKEVGYRIKWQGGKTVSTGTKMDWKGRRPVGSYEPYVGFRGANSTHETLSIHNRFGFTDGSVSKNPLKEITIKKTSRTQQTWAVSLDRVYRLSGKTNQNPGKGTNVHVLEVFDWKGKCLLTLDITKMMIPTTSDEPEGLTFSSAPGNLLAGKREGGSKPNRSYPIWTLTGLP